MSHHQTTRRAIWPEPDEGHLLDSHRFHRQAQQSLVKCVNGKVDRPTRKDKFSPPSEIEFLKVASGCER